MGLFDKKYCSVCGEKIGLLGNRKLEDGNLCKHCAAKLSPFFSERKHSTVADIKAQLDYRVANRDAVAALQVTRTFGDKTRILLDEAAGKFVVARSHNLAEENPDVIDCSAVTDVEIVIDEATDEEYKTDSEGNNESYTPPRFFYFYDFAVIIRVNHPYFDSIKVELASNVQLSHHAVPEVHKPNPASNADYCKYQALCEEIKSALMG